MTRIQFDEDSALLHLQRFCRRRNDYLASLPPGSRRPATNASSASLYSFIPQSPSSSSLLRSQRNASVKIQRYARARLRDARYSFVRRTRSSAVGGLASRGWPARPRWLGLRGLDVVRRVGGRPSVLRRVRMLLF